MSAPLTPADITALLGDGWQHSQDRYSHMWDRQDSIASVVLPNADAVAVTVYEASGWPWQVPATLTAVKFAAVLTLAGLIPGKVSVTQDDDYVLPPIIRRQAGMSLADIVDTCARCGRPAVLWVEFTHRPRVCSCSDEMRPTAADPCTEWTVTLSCRDCAPLFDPSLRAEVVDR